MVKISIIVPLYNKEAYIASTVQSVLTQSFQDWEMVIVDNGSTDRSLEIAKKIKDDRIHMTQSLKRGPGAARNFGLTHTQGEWIQFLDADDLLDPTYLESQLKITQHHPKADIVVSSWYEFIDNEPEKRALKHPAGSIQSLQSLLDTSIAFTPWAPHTAIVRRSILTEENLWPQDLDQFLAEDTAFWFQLICQYEVAYNSDAVALYRANTPNARTNLNPVKWFEGLHHAALKNLSYLDKNHIFPSFNQRENLVRLYCGIYKLASQDRNKHIQERSLSEANHWLRLYFENNNHPKASMILRSFLGLRLFLRLTSR